MDLKKGGIIFIAAVTIAGLLFTGITIYSIATKPRLFEYVKEFDNAEFRLYNDTYYHGIRIPEGVKLYLVNNVSSLNEQFIEIIFKKDGFTTMGRFFKDANEIWVLDSRFYDEKTRIIRHEVAHWQYANTLEDWEKEQIKTYYEYVCENPNEFYAYTIDGDKLYEDGFKGFFSRHQRVD